MNRLDRHRMFGRTWNPAHLRRRADVDADPVIGHGRTVFAQHLATGAVQADDLVLEKTRTRKAGQRAQIDVHIVMAVVACNVAGQHARVGRVAVAADQRQAHTRHGLHAPHLEHDSMAVAAADQHNIAQDRLFTRLHQRPCSCCFVHACHSSCQRQQQAVQRSGLLRWCKKWRAQSALRS